MSDSITLRLARRDDTPDLVRIANVGNGQSVIHWRIAPGQKLHPSHFHQWRLNVVRQRFATPNLRTIVAADSSSGQILGFASWVIEGPQTNLYKSWTAERSNPATRLFDWIETKIVSLEKMYFRYVVDRSTDYAFLTEFFAALTGGEGGPARPDCVHCHQIVVDPEIHGRGVGTRLLAWGKNLAARENLPLYLESNLEAVGFYEKSDFVRLNQDLVVKIKKEEKKGQNENLEEEGEEETFVVPAFVWTSTERKSEWLEEDVAAENGSRWRWKDEALKRSSS